MAQQRAADKDKEEQEKAAAKEAAAKKDEKAEEEQEPASPPRTTPAGADVYGQSPGPDYPAVAPDPTEMRDEPGKPAGPTALADASLSQPPSPPSLAQASHETREAAMAKAQKGGDMGEIFTLWTEQYQVLPPDSILISEVNPANDPRNVRVISKALYEELKRQQANQG